MSKTRTRLRSRTGSWNTFERRFRPRLQIDGTVLVDLHCLPAGIDPYLVWTITDDDGRLYLNAGFRFVNRFAYVICDVPWTDNDTCQPPYRYD